MASFLRGLLLLSWICSLVRIPYSHRVFFVAGLTSGTSYNGFHGRMQSSIP